MTYSQGWNAAIKAAAEVCEKWAKGAPGFVQSAVYSCEKQILALKPEAQGSDEPHYVGCAFMHEETGELTHVLTGDDKGWIYLYKKCNCPNPPDPAPNAEMERDAAYMEGFEAGKMFALLEGKS